MINHGHHSLHGWPWSTMSWQGWLWSNMVLTTMLWPCFWLWADQGHWPWSKAWFLAVVPFLKSVVNLGLTMVKTHVWTMVDHGWTMLFFRLGCTQRYTFYIDKNVYMKVHIRVPTRWWLSLLLLWFPHWHATAEWRDALRFAINQVRYGMHMSGRTRVPTRWWPQENADSLYWFFCCYLLEQGFIDLTPWPFEFGPWWASMYKMQ